MSGFVVVCRSAEPDNEIDGIRVEKAVAAFRLKGMAHSDTVVRKNLQIYLFSNESHDPLRALSTGADGAFCTYVGTLIYKGRTGAQATAAILEESRNGRPDCIDDALGNYCLLINDNSGLRIATDRAGLHHVYHNESLSLISNSFLAAACCLPKRTLQAHELIEYVQLGATFGASSLIRELQLLDAESEVQVQHDLRRIVCKKSVWDADAKGIRASDLEDALSRTIAACDEYYSQIGAAFGDQTTAAISGGYDSRLSLALMRRHHVSPKLFVYGSAIQADVKIAKMLCDGEGWKLNHMDRGSQRHLEPEEYWENQEAVFHGLDGLTQYGFACAPDEVSHRRERVAGGLVAINGGGGEIWRDFWKLRDGSMFAMEFVRAYFAGRLGGLVGGRAAERRFLSRLAEKVQAIAGSQVAPMSGPVVQSLYPRFRVRYWQGKNNSVDNHLGYAVTPFSEHRFTVPAMWIPMPAKRDGWFERQLIRRVSPMLASYVSSHGYDFEQGPTFADRVRINLTYRMPTVLRKLRRSMYDDRARPYYHSARFVKARFGEAPLEISKHLDVARLRDPLAFSRALTVERLIRGDWI